MSVEHVENPTIPNRVSMDKTVNALGRKLLQMCYNTGLTVSNGRLGNDMEGRFTFCTTRGRSVNDYLLLSPINYDKISAFEVKQFNEFSDHSPIFFELDFSNNRQPFEPPAVHSFIKWNNDKNHEYIQKLLSNQNTLFSLVDDIASVDDMNSVVRNISDILYKYAFEVYGRSVLIRDNAYPERPNNE